jgi:hypothetical protein
VKDNEIINEISKLIDNGNLELAGKLIKETKSSIHNLNSDIKSQYYLLASSYFIKTQNEKEFRESLLGYAKEKNYKINLVFSNSLDLSIIAKSTSLGIVGQRPTNCLFMPVIKQLRDDIDIKFLADDHGKTIEKDPVYGIKLIMSEDVSKELNNVDQLMMFPINNVLLFNLIAQVCAEYPKSSFKQFNILIPNWFQLFWETYRALCQMAQHAMQKKGVTLLFSYSKRPSFHTNIKYSNPNFTQDSNNTQSPNSVIMTKNGTRHKYGNRPTSDTPSKYDRSIYIMGDSTAHGCFVQDNETIPSHLQRKLNKNLTTPNYNVVNIAVSGEYPLIGLPKIFKMSVKPGDIIIIHSIGDTFGLDYSKLWEEGSYLEHDIYSSHPDDWSDVFFDDMHLNSDGNKIISNNIYQRLFVDKKMQTSITQPSSDIAINYAVKFIEEYYKRASFVFNEYASNPDLQEYLHTLSKLKISKNNVGSIVMNCNPFTFGHLHLIEYASAQVEDLIIYILEEDRSYFKFEDRMELVKSGVQHLKNVHVLRSGNFIISSSTFPEYFDKEAKNDAKIDASGDLDVFGSYIAPALNITKRFVGEEPIDMVTAQYNVQMKQILPYYGIAVEEIKRKEYASESVISASVVRKCIENQELEQLKNLVPKTTFEYITENFTF